jgi:hypothetical protein
MQSNYQNKAILQAPEAKEAFDIIEPTPEPLAISYTWFTTKQKKADHPHVQHHEPHRPPGSSEADEVVKILERIAQQGG